MATRRTLAQLALSLTLAVMVALPPAAALARPSQAPAAAEPSVAEPFRDYYNRHEGMRVLGSPLTGLVEVGAFPAQYFQKGRLEDHRAEATSPEWAFMYGRLTAELMQRAPREAVSDTSLTYGDLQQMNLSEHRVAPPGGFTGGSAALQANGGAFVPYDPALRPAPGYDVPAEFWAYINRAGLFPGGWLHDIGLPMTNALNARVVKDGRERAVKVQAFERAVLTLDPANPAEWRVERGNIGADAVRVLAPGSLVPSVFEMPAPGARLTLPVHLLARVGNPGDEVTATLRWANGVTLRNTFTILTGEDGKGLLIGNLDWVNRLAPPEPATQQAVITLHNASGALLASRSVTVLSPRDPATREVKVYWTISGNDEIVGPQARRIPNTGAIAAAALEELLWGPPPISQVGYTTAIPTPRDVLSFPGREPGWGPRVRLLGLSVAGGVATADFSAEMRAYGGGSLRVKLIHDQIAMTLKQFPSIREVRIAIEGQTEGVLEP